jgi:hypothetical protein
MPARRFARARHRASSAAVHARDGALFVIVLIDRQRVDRVHRRRSLRMAFQLLHFARACVLSAASSPDYPTFRVPSVPKPASRLSPAWANGKSYRSAQKAIEGTRVGIMGGAAYKCGKGESHASVRAKLRASAPPKSTPARGPATGQGGQSIYLGFTFQFYSLSVSLPMFVHLPVRRSVSRRSFAC